MAQHGEVRLDAPRRRLRLVVAAVVALGLPGGVAAAAGAQAASAQVPDTTEVTTMTTGIHWLGHDAFCIEVEGRVVYVDPYRLQRDQPKADLILITHDHHDHCSPEDVARVRGPHTVVVTVAAAASRLPPPVRVVQAGDTLTVGGIGIEAVAAYNTNKFRSPGRPFHPKDAGYVGFVIAGGGRRIYHAGDTDAIPEMASVKADVALLPVSGTYVMTAEEAVEAARIIQPRVAVPMHVGAGIGSLEDATRFKTLAPMPVVVLEMEP